MTAMQFNESLLSLQDKLRYFALSLTANEEDANDLLQETTLKALTYRKQFVSNTNFKAWVFTIMKNTFINNYRRIQKTRNTFESAEEVLDDIIFDLKNLRYELQLKEAFKPLTQ